MRHQKKVRGPPLPKVGAWLGAACQDNGKLSKRRQSNLFAAEQINQAASASARAHAEPP